MRFRLGLEHRAGTVNFSFNGQAHNGQLKSGVCTVENPVTDPQLWSPGAGDQVLYDLTVSAAATQKTLKVGLRQIDLVTTAGRGWPWFQDLRQQARCLCERRKLDPRRRACRADHA